MTKIKTVCIPHKIRIPLREGARGVYGQQQLLFTLVNFWPFEWLNFHHFSKKLCEKMSGWILASCFTNRVIDIPYGIHHNIVLIVTSWICLRNMCPLNWNWKVQSWSWSLKNLHFHVLSCQCRTQHIQVVEKCWSWFAFTVQIARNLLSWFQENR